MALRRHVQWLRYEIFIGFRLRAVTQRSTEPSVFFQRKEVLGTQNSSHERKKLLFSSEAIAEDAIRFWNLFL